MKQNKLVIVVLVVIVVLFVVGLSMGLFHGDEEHKNGMTMDQARSESQKDGWVSSLDGAMSSFRRKLDRGRLSPDENCIFKQTTYSLKESASTCEILIAEKDGATIQKAILSVKPNNVKVRVSYPDDKDCLTIGRGVPRVSLKKFRQSKAKINVSKIQPGKIKVGGTASPTAMVLDVIYTPTGENEQSNRCLVTGDVDLVVQEKGGLLKLVCTTGCDSNRSVIVELE